VVGDSDELEVAAAESEDAVVRADPDVATAAAGAQPVVADEAVGGGVEVVGDPDDVIDAQGYPPWCVMRSGASFSVTRTSPGFSPGYSSAPVYFLVSALMTSIAPSSVASSRRPSMRTYS
jgi:hypothetical protein